MYKQEYVQENETQNNFLRFFDTVGSPNNNDNISPFYKMVCVQTRISSRE